MAKKILRLFISIILIILPVTKAFSQNTMIHWKESDVAAAEVFEALNGIVSGKTSCLVKRMLKINKGVVLYNKNRIEEAQSYLDSNFVFLNGTVAMFYLKDKNQIFEWGRICGESLPAASIITHNEFSVGNHYILILLIYSGSGAPMANIYVFKDNGGQWELLNSAHTHTEGFVAIKKINNENVIVFETKDGRIGALTL